MLELLPGTLTKLDPPTWKGTVQDPPVSNYDDNSVGFWIRVGNTVWFSVKLIVNTGVDRLGPSINQNFPYWSPTADSAPSIDPAIYNNFERRSMVCGAALRQYARSTTFSRGVTEIRSSLTGEERISALVTGFAGDIGVSGYRSRAFIFLEGVYPTRD